METQKVIKNQEIEQLYEQIKTGMALFETARFNADKKVALPLAKQGLLLVEAAAKSFLDDPDLCPPYRKFPPKGPRPKWWDLVIDNPLLDPDYQYTNTHVLAVLENLRNSISSPLLKENLRGLSISTKESVNI